MGGENAGATALFQRKVCDSSLAGVIERGTAAGIASNADTLVRGEARLRQETLREHHISPPTLPAIKALTEQLERQPALIDRVRSPAKL